jgi:hypothetical protein
MAQQSARRGWDNQGFPRCYEHAYWLKSHALKQTSFRTIGFKARQPVAPTSTRMAVTIRGASPIGA